MRKLNEENGVTLMMVTTTVIHQGMHSIKEK